MRAILAKGTTDNHKSKLLTPHTFQLVIDVYGSPQDFAQIITKYDQKEFKIQIGEKI